MIGLDQNMQTIYLDVDRNILDFQTPSLLILIFNDDGVADVMSRKQQKNSL